jgi:hypothetical protein
MRKLEGDAGLICRVIEASRLNVLALKRLRYPCCIQLLIACQLDNIRYLLENDMKKLIMKKMRLFSCTSFGTKNTVFSVKKCSIHGN